MYIELHTASAFSFLDGASLPEDLKYSGRGVTAVEERELWHMPILLLSLIGVLCAEWGLRRYWRLA